MNRRQFAATALGSATVVAAGITQTNDTGERDCGAAYEPWRRWEEGSGILRAARSAILAANPHNTQPWRFKVGEDQLDLYGDLKRRIGAIDPILREQHIGAGCALENLVVAAAGIGLGVRNLSYDQDPAKDLIASVKFESSPAARSPLYEAIPHRHTNRGPYRVNCPISGSLFREFEKLNTGSDWVRLQIWTNQRSHARIKELIVAAAEAVVADEQQSIDSASWYRGTRAAIERRRDGITLDAQGMSLVMTALAKIIPEPSRSMADHVFLNNTKNVYCGPGAIYGTIAAKAPACKESMARVGRLWQRMHLRATANGIAMQPINQIHERIDREQTSGIDPVFTRDLAALIQEPNWTGVFSFRMGYAARKARPSPRRDLSQFLV